MNEEELAKAAAAAMWENDKAARALGMSLDEVTLGYARLSVKVTQSMVNGHDITHGGYIFMLADTAFAFACNSHNQNAVAQHCAITYVAPGNLGDTMIAEAKERYQVGRSGIYDVTVRNQDGEVLAEFRGNSRTIKGVHVEV